MNSGKLGEKTAFSRRLFASTAFASPYKEKYLIIIDKDRLLVILLKFGKGKAVV